MSTQNIEPFNETLVLVYDGSMGKIVAALALFLLTAVACYLFLNAEFGSNFIVSPVVTDNSSITKRLDTLDTEVAFLMQRVTGERNPNFLDDKKNVEGRLTTLEKEVASLSGQPIPSDIVESTPSSGPILPPSYIPLNWQASSTTLNWTSISSQQFVIDSVDYPNATSAQFQVQMRVFEGNGTASAVLYDVEDNTLIGSSQVSTTSQDYTWLYSSTFPLPSGKHTYELELKSLTGYSADVENARLRINF